MAVDITINETIDVVDITVNPNIIEVNVTRTSGGGAGSQTLAQTLALGNTTGGENIVINNADAIELENGSKLSQGIVDAGTGGNKGISLTCAVGFEWKFEAGEAYLTETTSGYIRLKQYARSIPSVNDDITKGFVVDSLWYRDNGDTWYCIDSTEGNAGWAFRNNGVPTLDQVLVLGGNLAQSIPIILRSTGNDFELRLNESEIADIKSESELSDKRVQIDPNGIYIGDFTQTNPSVFIDREGIVINDVSYLYPTGASSPLATLADINGATPTLQEVTDEGATTTNAITVGAITAGNLSYDGFQFLITDNELYSFNYTPFVGIAISNLDENTSVDILQDATIVFTKELGAGVLSSNLLTGLRNWELPDASGTLALTSDIPTLVAGTNITIDDTDPLNPIISSTGGGGGGVPYTGATQDLNLGEFGLLTGNIEFDTTPTNIPTTAGSMVWNDTDGTVDLKLKGGNVTLQVGQENVLRVVNKTATNINLLEANYQAVRVTGAQGQRLKVDLAQATTDALSAETIGLVTETINNNQEGFITTSGLIRNVNTTGSLQSETWADGDILYLSPTTAGQLTKVKPTAPNHLVIIGYVVHAHATQGSIFVKVDNGYELNELHNVKITSETNNQLLSYTSATDIWENKNLIDILERFNRTQGIYLFEEFMGNQGGGITTNFTGLITTQTGTGANCITTGTITNRTNQQGVIRTQTGTTATGQAGFLYGGVNLFRGNGTISIETYTTVETLSTSTERFFTIFGNIGVANYLNPANGIFFTYDEGGVIGSGANAGSPNFKCVSINTLSRTFFTSSVPVVAGQWYKLRIDINAAGTQASFYIDGNLITTLTTNIPATSTAMGVHSVIVKTVGTTTRATQTDYFMYEEIFTNPR